MKARTRQPLSIDDVDRYDGDVHSELAQRLIDTVLTYDERRSLKPYDKADQDFVYGKSFGSIFIDYHLTAAVEWLRGHGRFLRFWGVTFGHTAIGVTRSTTETRS